MVIFGLLGCSRKPAAGVFFLFPYLTDLPDLQSTLFMYFPRALEFSGAALNCVFTATKKSLAFTQAIQPKHFPGA